MKKGVKIRYIIPVAIMLLMLLLNVIARCSRSFADFYVRNIFPAISSVFSFITGIFPFSVGEVMIVLLILLIVVGLPAVIIMLIAMKKHRWKVAGIAVLTVLWVSAYILTTETMNCFIMYQCTPFSERYFSHKEHTREEIIQLYAALIKESNSLAEKVPRDEEDRFYVDCDVDSEARKAMKRAAEDFSQLSGYYPKAKPIFFSYFMSQAGLSGIYFPFSFEANYNNAMVNTNLPDTICHEYAHLKGIIQEDEANFIGYIACINSDEPQFRYSGCLSALEYVHNQIYENEISDAYFLTDEISDKVRADWFRFLPDDYWEKNKKKEVISTETISKVSDAAIDTNIKMNGREEGKESYSLVVNMLLDYYFPA